MQGIQHVRDCTITIEMAVCPMADRGTQMGPNGCAGYGAMHGTNAVMMFKVECWAQQSA